MTLMTPTPANDALTIARAEIDAIDHEMHRLLMCRAGIVARIEAAKKVEPGRSAYRPAREADMMRRLALRHHGPFPLAATEHIWREIITTFIHLQAPFTVHLASRTLAFRDLARFQFGSTTPLELHDEALPAICALKRPAKDLALVPIEDGINSAWWRELGHEPNPIFILARLPFFPGTLALPDAFVIGRVKPEATGQDRSLVALFGPTTTAPETIAEIVPGATAIASHIESGVCHVLASVPGMFSPAPSQQDYARFVGAYALPQASERA